MHLSYTPEEEAFRAEVRAFLATELPQEMRDRVRSGRRLDKADILRWQNILYRRGWGAGMWPKRFGGADWTVFQQYIFDEECAVAGTPMQLPFSVKMVAPVLMTFGNAAQQEYFLPRILAGEDWWCQGYSEPGSGSDLASLRTAAVRDGDDYVVNGQKTWNTYGQYADWIFCLVRTQSAGRPQEGISFLLVDMKSPGVSVRPIITLDGEHEINDVFFDNVRVPVENRVGEENRGWTYAKFLLGHERTNTAGIGNCKRALARVKQMATTSSVGARPMWADTRFRDRLARVELELTALEITNLRVLSAMSRGSAPGPEVSALKIKGSEIIQELVELQMHVLGPAAIASLPEAPTSGQYFNLRKTTIYAGSTEIQKNIIAKLVLGL
jgi:alkylation response protein AidB-like acyl-CoA dehydrogenase